MSGEVGNVAREVAGYYSVLVVVDWPMGVAGSMEPEIELEEEEQTQ